MGSIPFCTICGLEVRVGEEWATNSSVLLIDDAPRRTFLKHTDDATCLTRIEEEAGKLAADLKAIELKRAELMRARKPAP